MRPTHLINTAKPEVSIEFDIYDCAYMYSGNSSKLADPLSPHASPLTAAEFANLAQSAISVPSEILVDGSIDVVGELDVYSFEVVAGETYMLSVYGSGADPLEDTVVYLADDTFTIVNLDDDGGAGRMSLLTFTASYTGTYYAAIEGYPGLGLTGDYTFDIVQQPATDVVPDTFGGAVDLTIGEVTYGFIDSGVGTIYGPNFGEVDTFAIEVEAGKYYTIEVAGGADYASDWFDLPPGEIDPVVVIYGPDGSYVTDADDISFPSDISTRVSFLAEETGTYYLDVFSWAPWTGGYSITSQEVDLSTLDPVESLIWDSAANIDPGTDGVVTVYFATPGESFGEFADNGVDPLPSFGWNAFEKQQVMTALAEYSKILGFTYVETTNSADADFRLITTTSNQYGAYFYPQDPSYGTQQGIGAFNVDSGAWDFDQQQSLTQGGFAFAVVLHEFGHAHGLAHPHDTGGGSDVLAGVTSSTGSYGVYDLNQGVYTVMSYNDAWPTGPNGETPFTIANVDSGWSGTLSAFDIAALQERYGIINDYATGNDVYELGDANDPGVYYETIWDTGGKDEIRYSGSRNARIDLLAATIDYTPTGGGVVSYVDDIFGGYTIARGVVIENATGGGGDDVLIGNSAVNVIKGNGGDDWLMGREGGDTLDGGAGFDTASYSDADGGVKASLASNKGTSGDAAGDKFISIEKLEGSAFADQLTSGNGSDVLSGLDGNDTLSGGNQNDTLDGGDGNDDLDGGNHDDTLIGGGGNDTLDGGNHDDVLDGGDGDDMLSGGNHDDVLLGGDGDDTLSGGNHKDILNGGAGNDTLTGGNHNDVFAFTDLGGEDVITDFRRGQDKIDLSGLDAVDGGGDDAFTWVGSSAFSNTAGELRSYSQGGDHFLAGDVDGDGVADFLIETNQAIISSDDVL